MIRLSLILTFTILSTISSCGQAAKEVTSEALKGSWYLNKWTTSHTLIFSDKTVFVDNNIDTVFTLNYAISYDSLMTWAKPNQKIKNKIINITKDSLILDGIGELKETRCYSRTKRGYN